MILVTGGAGYIGSHVGKLLHRQGRPFAVYDNLSSGHRSFCKWSDLFEGELHDLNRLREAFDRYRPEAVIHCAALASVADSVRHPLQYYQSNVINTLNLLQVMRERGVRKIVFSSSCATYGVPDALPIREESRQHPINPYGRTKLIVEQVLADCAVAYGLRSVSLRYFNAAGADRDAEIGELRAVETHLIPRVLDAVQAGSPRIEVFGSDYPTVDGTCVRDYVHVEDIAEAHGLALDSLQADARASVYNLGIGRGYTVRQVLEVCERVTGSRIEAVALPRRPGDPPELWCDPARARRELGWQPRYTDLESIVRTAWAWHLRKPARHG